MSGTRYRTLKTPNKLLSPIILMIGFVPAIVHMYVYDAQLSQFEWFPNDSDTQADFFFAWKMIAIMILAVVMAGILLYRHFKKREKLLFENSFYLLFFYALFVAMSALFSEYRHWVSAGTFELFEPVWVLFGYMIVCYYTYQYVQEEKQVYTLLKWAGVGALIVTLIGVFQAFKLDFFKSTLGKMLILNPSNWSIMDEVEFTLPAGRAYTTLYNPNYLSFYFGMLIPLIACLFVAAKKLKYRIPLAVAEVLVLICLKSSGSDSGWMAVVIGCGIVAIVLCSRTKKSRIAIGGVAAVGVVAAVVVCLTTSFGQSLIDTIVGTYRLEERVALWSIDTRENDVALNINGNELYISCAYDESGLMAIICLDGDGNVVQTTYTDETMETEQIADSRYNGNRITTIDETGEETFSYAQSEGEALILRPSDYGEGIYISIDGIECDFLKESDAYYYVNAAGKLVDLDVSEASRLFREDAMSGRGRIWNNTIPVLAKHLFIGTGANTFLFATTQEDYIYKLSLGLSNSYDVKAHCWYLQQWVENGLIATLLLIGFGLWYLIRSARIYRRADLREPITWVGIGVYTAVLVYFTAALANDSNAGTAPVFWGMLGLGMAVNRIIVNKEKLLELAESSEEAPQKGKALSAEKAASTAVATQTAGSGNTKESTEKTANAGNAGNKTGSAKKTSGKSGKKKKKRHR